MNSKPIILYEGKYSLSQLKSFEKENKIWQLVDVYKEQLEEFFEILYPTKKFSPDYREKLNNFIQKRSGDKSDLKGNWVYYPWSGYLVHSIGEVDYNALRTNRNKNLVTEEEQKRLMKACVGFVGLSIGSHFAIGMAHSGIANAMKLVEFDSLSTSNLNRIKAGLKDVGTSKIDLTAQGIYEVNPYADLTLYPEGLNEQLLDSFLNKGKKPVMIFEAIDDFEMKMKLRLAARKVCIPVIMLTNLGDNILVDIERYDQDFNLSLFNGLIGDTPEEILKGGITEKAKVKYAVALVDIENVPRRALESLFQINKTLVGRPQLFNTVTMAGGLASYLARRIILNLPLPSCRKFISIDKLLQVDFENSKEQSKRQQVIQTFQKIFKT